jgi:hypothetical protein
MVEHCPALEFCKSLTPRHKLAMARFPVLEISATVEGLL